MKKVLVVEDEYYARKSIVKILEESGLDLQVCAEAENGEKAKEILEKTEDIDLVITDIQMKKIGGLELAAYLYEYRKEIAIIILTAFENFEYARTALRYSVLDYIVKPIHKENLLPAVKRVFEKQEEKSRNQEKIKNYYEREAAKNYFPMKTILAHEELYREFFKYKSQHPHEKFCMAVMQQESNFQKEDIDFVNKAVQEKYSGWVKDFFFSRVNDEYIMLFCTREDAGGEAEIYKEIEGMMKYLHTCGHLELTVGVGQFYREETKLYQSYNEALYSLNQRLIQGWNKVYLYRNMNRYDAKIGKEQESRLDAVLRTRREEEISEVIHEILYEIVEKEESAQKLYVAVVGILKILGNYYAELYQEENIENIQDIRVMFSRRYDLYKFKHMEELENYLDEIVKNMCSGSGNTKRKSKIIEEIIHYVEQNYYRNISLRELAENKYFINYSYCSRLFSQETGMTFSKYVIQYRLEKAKILLLNDNMKINYIAFEVGYNDVSHFIQSFKKTYGMTPEEYRIRKKSHISK